MNLELDKNITKNIKNSDTLTIKKIYKESIKNMDLINQKIDLLTEILDDKKIKNLEIEYKKLNEFEEIKNNLLKDFEKINLMKKIIIELDTKTEKTEKK